MSAKSYSSAIEEIKSRANIVDVISSVVTLKRAGSNYKGICPFHKEKTPSFMVSEHKQIFTCFGCGASGDVIEFVKRYYSLSFQEAVEKLAAQYGIEIQELYGQDNVKKDPYYEANRLAARYFYSSFIKPGNPAYAYMQKRELKPETLKKFGIGYADESWTGLTDHLQNQGISKEMLLELGLSSEKNGRVYDKFRDRVIFPIINTRDKVIGFGGRIMGDGEPKYLNSQDSLVFQKKYNLFGLNLTRTEIQKEGYAILVEGYMDVASLYQAGVRNVGASLGTALTENQAKLLKRYTDKVILCYDADAAGIKAALRGIDILRAAGLEVKVLHVDEGKDPDEYIKKHGRDAFLEMMRKNALQDVDYKVALIRRKYNTYETEGAVKFLKATAEVLRGLSPIEADLYIKKIASENKVSESALRREVEIGGKRSAVQMDAPPGREKEPEKEVRPPDKSAVILERTLIRLSLLKSEYFKGLEESPECMVTPEGSRIFSVMAAMYTDGADFDYDKLCNELEDNELAYLKDLTEQVKIGGKDAETYEDCMLRLHKNKLRRRQSEIKDVLELAGPDENPEMINKLMLELSDINKELKKG